MMIGQLGWEKIDLIRLLKHLAAMLQEERKNGSILRYHSAFVGSGLALENSLSTSATE